MTIPAGESPHIGIGGHVSGGAFGFLCRQHGLAVDHLHGVEAVVVDDTGTARSVVATRDASDPNRDLWWAHTGGGGGNFGVVTRYWFRSPGAREKNPTLLLPKAPDSVLAFRVAWNWEDIDEAAFTRLVRNFGDWCERHGHADSPSAELYTLLFRRRRQYGKLEMKGLSTAGPEAERLFDEHLAAISDGVGAPHSRDVERSSWLGFALDPFPELFKVGMENALFKVKDDPQDEARNLAWVRAFYRDLFADTGGVAVPGEVCDGAMINHPDVDLADPKWNTSGVPWHALYYKDNYPRLQQIKSRWDPRNVFHHALSVRPAP